jgi:hypothetical protein
MSATPFPNPLPPLTPESEADLRASIAKRGVLIPAVVDQHGRTLDGNHRERLAAELGVDMPAPVVVEIDDDGDALEVAVEINTARRHLNVETRRNLVAGLRAEGKSVRAIADELGVARTTVHRDLASGVPHGTPAPGGDNSPPGSVVGQDGKTYPAKRTLKNPASEAQIRYLAKLCRERNVDMPTLPISKPRASKLIERLKDGPPQLDAGWFIKGLRALVELAEDAAPLGAEFVPAQPLVTRLAAVMRCPANGDHRSVWGREYTPDELQALVDAGVDR